MKTIISEAAPAAIGPYSHAVVSNGFVFVSGQTGTDPKTGTFAGDDVEAQAEQAIVLMKAILEECGTNLESVVKTTCFLSDMNDFAKFNSVYEKYFTQKPARSCFAVKTLPKNAKVEIEAIAEI